MHACSKPPVTKGGASTGGACSGHDEHFCNPCPSGADWPALSVAAPDRQRSDHGRPIAADDACTADGRIEAIKTAADAKATISNRHERWIFIAREYRYTAPSGRRERSGTAGSRF